MIKHHSDYDRPLFITWLCRSCHAKIHGEGLSVTVEGIDYSDTQSNPQKQVRLEQDIYNALVSIQKNCDWPVALGVLANYAARHGMIKTRNTFNPKSK